MVERYVPSISKIPMYLFGGNRLIPMFRFRGRGPLGKTLFESFLGELLALRALGLPRDLASFSEFPNP